VEFDKIKVMFFWYNYIPFHNGKIFSLILAAVNLNHKIVSIGEVPGYLFKI